MPGALALAILTLQVGSLAAQQPANPTPQSDAPAVVILPSDEPEPLPAASLIAPVTPSEAAPTATAGPATSPLATSLVAPAVGSSTQATAAPTDPANLEQRVQELEGIIKQMQAELQQSLTAPASAAFQDPMVPPDNPMPPEPSPAFNPIGSEGEAPAPLQLNLGIPGWKGFTLGSPDKAFMLRITGQLQLDYREYLRTKDRNDIDTFLVRRARIGLEATLEKYYEFRILPDFGQGTTVLQDAYMNIHYWNEFQFEIGRFKQPISYEELIQDRYVPTLERSLIDQLVPERDLGAMIHGEDVFANHLDYAVSLSNGEINGTSLDTNDHKDLDARVAVRPFNDPDNYEWLRWFQIGVSGGFGVEQEAISPSSLKMPDTVTFFTFNSTVRANGLRTRLCPELAYYYGPLGFLAEYYDQQQDMSPTATGKGSGLVEDVPFRGYLFLASCLLTGETRTTYSEQIAPLRNFDPRHPISNPGAWELVVRTSHLDVGDIVYSKGTAELANPATTANVATDLTVGFNWYFNAFVRVQFNYEHDMFNRSVLLGPSAALNELRSQDSLFTRFQIIF